MDAVTAEQQRQIDWLLEETRRRDGLAPVDVERFWADQAVARVNPFGADIPQVPLGVMMSGECVFAELGLPEDQGRYQRDETWRLELNREYNVRAERIVGRKLLGESTGDPTRRWPGVKMLHDIFEARNEWGEQSQSYWLHQSADTPEELAALLDRVDARLQNLAEFVLPPNWAEEKARLTALGVHPPRYRGQRGPVTFATSIYGVENLLFLILDQPDLAARLRDTILRAMLGLARVLDEEAGDTPAVAPRGFSFLDDNCCLLTPDMYEFFGYPILKGVFEVYSSNPGESRYQHSDSAMGHLLPIFGKLGMTRVNFGPTVRVADIREHLPGAVIDGQLAPFTLSRNQSAGIVWEFLRDFEQARDRRGLVFATAGSINNGSLLTSMRLIMAAIQHFGRFDQ